MDTSLEARIECLVTGKLGSLYWQAELCNNVQQRAELWFINIISCQPSVRPVIQFCSAYITHVNAQLLPRAGLLMWWWRWFTYIEHICWYVGLSVVAV